VVHSPPPPQSLPLGLIIDGKDDNLPSVVHPPPQSLPLGLIIDGKDDNLPSSDIFQRVSNPEIIVPPTTSAAVADDVDLDVAIEKGLRRAATEVTKRAIVAASNVHPTNNTTAATIAPQFHPTLPNGEIINAKNINQSYDDVEIGNTHPNIRVRPAAVVATNHLDDGPHENLNNHIGSNYNDDTAVPMNETITEINDTNVLTVHAFAVSSIQLVEAEPIVRVAACNRSSTFWLLNGLVVVMAMMGVGVGVYCGTGNCTPNRGSNATISSDNVGNTTSSDSAGNSTSSDNAGNSTSSDSAGNLTPPENTLMLLEFIHNITLSNESITINGTNPESRAVAWMFNNAEFFNMSSLISTTNNGASFRVRQQFSLLTMWFQQTTTEQWVNVNGWLNDPDECNWYGISCQTMDLGESMGMQNVVTQIDFYNVDDDDATGNNFFGTIPADLGLLTMLEHFGLKGNPLSSDEGGSSLNGTLPASIGQWTALTYFAVENNGLSGSLPESIGQWTALTYFGFFNNALTGTLPESIGQWTALTSFVVSGNVLTGPFPESIEQWTALELFVVGDNSLTGTLPESIGQWTALTYFDASNNFALNGTLPDSIGQWIALTSFYFSDSTLAGTLPEFIGQWTALEIFKVYNNSLTGAIPVSIGNWSQIYDVSFNNNQFTGTIPASIGNWSLVDYAYFYNNQFTGVMPIEICPYINATEANALEADCVISCNCCTNCY
jgi:hypothetical protein